MMRVKESYVSNPKPHNPVGKFSCNWFNKVKLNYRWICPKLESKLWRSYIFKCLIVVVAAKLGQLYAGSPWRPFRVDLVSDLYYFTVCCIIWSFKSMLPQSNGVWLRVEVLLTVFSFRPLQANNYNVVSHRGGGSSVSLTSLDDWSESWTSLA